MDLTAVFTVPPWHGTASSWLIGQGACFRDGKKDRNIHDLDVAENGCIGT